MSTLSTGLCRPGIILYVALVLLAARSTRSAPVQESDSTQVAEYDAGSSGCYYNFQHYQEGARIVTNEPCLNCTCHNRMLMCYLRVCPFTKAIGQDCTAEKRPDQCCPVITCPEISVQLLTSTTSSPAKPANASSGATDVGAASTTELGFPDSYGCNVDERFYADGAQLPLDPHNPCELCYCIRNKTTCLMQQCTLAVAGCRPVYQPGVCCPVKYNCEYDEDYQTTPGLIMTTTPVPHAEAPKCSYDDRLYEDGELIYTIQPCQHCYCFHGEIVCAVQECGRPMDAHAKNCTAVPPLDGQCCPTTYQCDDGSGLIATEIPSMEKDHQESFPGADNAIPEQIPTTDETQTVSSLGNEVPELEPTKASAETEADSYTTSAPENKQTEAEKSEELPESVATEKSLPTEASSEIPVNTEESSRGSSEEEKVTEPSSTAQVPTESKVSFGGEEVTTLATGEKETELSTDQAITSPASLERQDEPEKSTQSSVVEESKQTSQPDLTPIEKELPEELTTIINTGTEKSSESSENSSPASEVTESILPTTSLKIEEASEAVQEMDITTGSDHYTTVESSEDIKDKQTGDDAVTLESSTAMDTVESDKAQNTEAPIVPGSSTVESTESDKQFSETSAPMSIETSTENISSHDEKQGEIDTVSSESTTLKATDGESKESSTSESSIAESTELLTEPSVPQDEKKQERFETTIGPEASSIASSDEENKIRDIDGSAATEENEILDDHHQFEGTEKSISAETESPVVSTDGDVLETTSSSSYVPPGSEGNASSTPGEPTLEDNTKETEVPEQGPTGFQVLDRVPEHKAEDKDAVTDNEVTEGYIPTGSGMPHKVDSLQTDQPEYGPTTYLPPVGLETESDRQPSTPLYEEGPKEISEIEGTTELSITPKSPSETVGSTEEIPANDTLEEKKEPTGETATEPSGSTSSPLEDESLDKTTLGADVSDRSSEKPSEEVTTPLPISSDQSTPEKNESVTTAKPAFSDTGDTEITTEEIGKTDDKPEIGEEISEPQTESPTVTESISEGTSINEPTEKATEQESTEQSEISSSSMASSEQPEAITESSIISSSETSSLPTEAEKEIEKAVELPTDITSNEESESSTPKALEEGSDKSTEENMINPETSEPSNVEGSTQSAEKTPEDTVEEGHEKSTETPVDTEDQESTTVSILPESSSKAPVEETKLNDEEINKEISTTQPEIQTKPVDDRSKVQEPTTTQLAMEESVKSTEPSKIDENVSEGEDKSVPSTPMIEIETSTSPQIRPAHGIPGEGNCLVDGQSYSNNSAIPPANPCQLSCQCVSSIVQCELVQCTPPPADLLNCIPLFTTDNACCPMYTCDSTSTVELQVGNKMTDRTPSYEEVGQTQSTPESSDGESTQGTEATVATGKDESTASSTEPQIEITSAESVQPESDEKLMPPSSPAEGETASSPEVTGSSEPTSTESEIPVIIHSESSSPAGIEIKSTSENSEESLATTEASQITPEKPVGVNKMDGEKTTTSGESDLESESQTKATPEDESLLTITEGAPSTEQSNEDNISIQTSPETELEEAVTDSDIKKPIIEDQVSQTTIVPSIPSDSVTEKIISESISTSSETSENVTQPEDSGITMPSIKTSSEESEEPTELTTAIPVSEISSPSSTISNEESSEPSEKEPEHSTEIDDQNAQTTPISPKATEEDEKISTSDEGTEAPISEKVEEASVTTVSSETSSPTFESTGQPEEEETGIESKPEESSSQEPSEEHTTNTTSQKESNESTSSSADVTTISSSEKQPEASASPAEKTPEEEYQPEADRGSDSTTIGSATESDGEPNVDSTTSSKETSEEPQSPEPEGETNVEATEPTIVDEKEQSKPDIEGPIESVTETKMSQETGSPTEDEKKDSDVNTNVTPNVEEPVSIGEESSLPEQASTEVSVDEEKTSSITEADQPEVTTKTSTEKEPTKVEAYPDKESPITTTEYSIKQMTSEDGLTSESIPEDEKISSPETTIQEASSTQSSPTEKSVDEVTTPSVSQEPTSESDVSLVQTTLPHDIIEQSTKGILSQDDLTSSEPTEITNSEEDGFDHHQTGEPVEPIPIGGEDQRPELYTTTEHPEMKPHTRPDHPDPAEIPEETDDESIFPPDGADIKGPYDEETTPEYDDDQAVYGPGTCRYGGKIYMSAQQIPRDDPCDFCFCFRSDIICLQQSCPPPIPGCHEEPIGGFCCPRYECPVSMAMSLNATTTTTTTTTTVPPHFLSHAYKGSAYRGGCQIGNRAYRVGEEIKSKSGPCMGCTCGGDGKMKCEPKACSASPMLKEMIAHAAAKKRRR